VQVVMRHQPLGFHARAKPAAIAMQAAHRQGKAWPMSALLFENRRKLLDEDFSGYAAKLGLDVARFEKDYADPEVAREVNADKKLAVQLGVTGTPACFINGTHLRGAKPYAVFKAHVVAEIKVADKLLASGTPYDALYKTLADAKVKAKPKPKPKAKAKPKAKPKP
jgi:predicted DsbA family dithiol-disulfide isomerase